MKQTFIWQSEACTPKRLEWDALKEGLRAAHGVLSVADFKDIFVNTWWITILVGKVTHFSLQIIEDQLSLFLVILSLPLISIQVFKQVGGRKPLCKHHFNEVRVF